MINPCLMLYLASDAVLVEQNEKNDRKSSYIIKAVHSGMNTILAAINNLFHMPGRTIKFAKIKPSFPWTGSSLKMVSKV